MTFTLDLLYTHTIHVHCMCIMVYICNFVLDCLSTGSNIKNSNYQNLGLMNFPLGKLPGDKINSIILLSF